MDLKFDERLIHVPPELISVICGFLDNVSDICAARLANRSFCAAATPWITDMWHSPSLLFVKANFSAETQAYGCSGVDLGMRPRWIATPVTVWTWLEIPSDTRLENENDPAGRRFAELLTAPHGEREAFHKYGRKALSWGRMHEHPNVFCIVTQWHCEHSWALYRDSKEADALRSFLDNVAPGCVSSSTSEYTPIAAHLKRQQPLFNGYYDIFTVYFWPDMTEQQKRRFEATCHLYRDESMTAWEHHLGFSPWWWIRGLRSFQGQTAVAARFAFFWRNVQLENSHKYTRTRCVDNAQSHGSERRVVELFDEELQAAGVIGRDSSHFNFLSGQWRN